MIRTALLVAGKDLRIEARSRVLLWQVVPFGVIALVLAGLAMGPSRANASGSGPGLFYLVLLLVSVLMSTRSHAIERGAGTRSSVATLGLDPAGVFLGKALALTAELAGSAVVLAAGSVLLLHTSLPGTLRAAPSILIAVMALSAAGTLYGALTAGEGAATLLPLLALPAMSPLLIAGERAYSSALSGSGLWEWWLILLAGLVAYVGLGVLLYGVLEDL